MLRSKPRILAVLPSTIASCMIGVVKPLTALARRGEIEAKVVLESEATAQVIASADLVVFCRNTEPKYAEFLDQALRLGKPVIFDLDDNFWDIPYEIDSELAAYHRTPNRIKQLEKYIARSNLVRVYSPVMKELCSRLSSNVLLVKAGMDFSLVAPPKARPETGKVKIVYATSRTVDTQYKLFYEGLLKVQQTYPEHVDICIWGCQPKEFVGRSGFRILPLVGEYQEFVKQFYASEFDIGLAPLESDQFHRSKTNTKLRDYGACGVAGIYSNVDVYSTVIRDGETGLLVENDAESWFAAIEKLIKDPELRSKIQRQAYWEVYEGFRQELLEAEWLKEIHVLLGSKGATDAAKTAKFEVKTARSNLTGFKVGALGNEEELAAGSVMLEVLNSSGNVMREISNVTCSVTEARELCFHFTPIANSADRKFTAKLVVLSGAKNALGANFLSRVNQQIEPIYA